MKDLFYLSITSLISLALIFASCADNRLEDSIAPDQGLRAAEGRGRVPFDAPIFAYLSHPEQYTWTEVDRYYREEVLGKAAGADYFDNLRKMTIMGLVNTFQLPEKAGPEVLAYYVGEMQTLPLTPPDELLKCLQGLKGYWPDAKRQSVARSEYERAVRHINARFPDAENYLLKSGHRYEALNTFAANPD